MGHYPGIVADGWAGAYTPPLSRTYVQLPYSHRITQTAFKSLTFTLLELYGTMKGPTDGRRDGQNVSSTKSDFAVDAPNKNIWLPDDHMRHEKTTISTVRLVVCQSFL